MEWKLIHSYTRAEALADGVLRDATLSALAVGFRTSVALTAACWAECVSFPLVCAEETEFDRLWNVLVALRRALLQPDSSGSDVDFRVEVRRRAEAGELVRLKAVFGLGDAGEHVVTIMLPGED